MTELQTRRRALMAIGESKNYLEPSNAAGSGTSDASVEDGNIIRIRTLSKSADNRVRAYFHRGINVVSGDVIRWVMTPTGGSITQPGSKRPMFNDTYMSETHQTLRDGFDISYTITATVTIESLAIHNSSNPSTGNATFENQFYVNGKQVI